MVRDRAVQVVRMQQVSQITSSTRETNWFRFAFRVRIHDFRRHVRNRPYTTNHSTGLFHFRACAKIAHLRACMLVDLTRSWRQYMGLHICSYLRALKLTTSYHGRHALALHCASSSTFWGLRSRCTTGGLREWRNCIADATFMEIWG